MICSVPSPGSRTMTSPCTGDNPVDKVGQSAEPRDRAILKAVTSENPGANCGSAARIVVGIFRHRFPSQALRSLVVRIVERPLYAPDRITIAKNFDLENALRSQCIWSR